MSLLLYMIASFGAARFRLNAAREEERKLAQSCAAMQGENELLRQTIASAGSDESIEAMARDRLGLVMPGERVYYFR